ncbi:hypothetical protein A3C78_02320 [Candidatus Azambacteria bacterium RIFCSPHIGHO2_02_FULL_45_18]|nr:MAG: hypothetical protein A3C78_02320 [Candidatus Azambacteria bacterium RIFCSPHIGHO2_02_FULL_45_18]
MIKMNITKENNSLQSRIMRRVYAIWFAKRVLPYVVIEAAGFVSVVYALGRLVYVRHVVDNALVAFAANPWGWAFYMADSFFYRKPVIQALSLGAAVLFIFAVRNVLKALVELNVMQRETKPARASFYR